MNRGYEQGENGLKENAKQSKEDGLTCGKRQEVRMMSHLGSACRPWHSWGIDLLSFSFDSSSLKGGRTKHMYVQ